MTIIAEMMANKPSVPPTAPGTMFDFEALGSAIVKFSSVISSLVSFTQ